MSKFKVGELVITKDKLEVFIGVSRSFKRGTTWKIIGIKPIEKNKMGYLIFPLNLERGEEWKASGAQWILWPEDRFLKINSAGGV